MLLITEPDRVEADLAAGRLACGCGGRLHRWGYAATRRVRQLTGTPTRLRPRRARCVRCRVTHVLLPAWCLPRRGDAAEVIGAALIAKAAGHGYRAIAAQLDRPAATVRGWLRRARGEHAAWLYRQGVTHAARLDPDLLNQLEPAGSAVGDALAALAAAVAGWRRRLRQQPPTWAIVGVLTEGRLLAPPRHDQQVGGVGRVCPRSAVTATTSTASV
jgi:hypothetical protein